jgi:hypothetical protein
MITYNEDDIRRFESKIDKFSSNPCWIFISADHNRFGHRRVWIAGKFEGSHRFAYTIYKEQILDGLEVCHTCDNPRCVNPDHLVLMTKKENQMDKVYKGRHAFGSNNGASVLIEDEVVKMRELRKAGLQLQEIADIYGVSRSTAHNAVSPKSKFWRNV